MLFKQFKAVFNNSFSVCAGDPFFLVINLSMLVFMVLAASMPSLGPSESLRLIRDQTHSIIFISGVLVSLFGLIRVVTDDIRRGAGSILMSRPISGAVLLSGKLAGVLGCSALLFLSGAMAYLWVTEINYYEEMNLTSLFMFIGAVVLALVAGVARQYMFGSNFSKYTCGALAVLLSLGVAFRYASGVKGQFDIQGLSSLVLLFMAVVAFASVVLIISIIADSAMVLAGGIVVFFTGLLAEYFFGTVLGGNLGNVLVSILPNWQTFWVLEKLGIGETVSLAYCLQCATHSILQSIFCLVLAVILFDRIEIKGVA
jgi:hypothetical protein